MNIYIYICAYIFLNGVFDLDGTDDDVVVGEKVKRVCYYEYEPAAKRVGNATFLPKDVNTELCSHVMLLKETFSGMAHLLSIKGW